MNTDALSTLAVREVESYRIFTRLDHCHVNEQKIDIDLDKIVRHNFTFLYALINSYSFVIPWCSFIYLDFTHN